MITSTSIWTRLVVGSAAVLATGVVAAPASAHHSFAMYDQSQSLTFTGRVTRFIPGANHAQILFDHVDDEPRVGTLVVITSRKDVAVSEVAGRARWSAEQVATPKQKRPGVLGLPAVLDLPQRRAAG